MWGEEAVDVALVGVPPRGKVYGEYLFLHFRESVDELAHGLIELGSLCSDGIDDQVVLIQPFDKHVLSNLRFVFGLQLLDHVEVQLYPIGFALLS